jgi:hypothetical protein
MKKLLIGIVSIVLIFGSIYLVLSRYEQKSDSFYSAVILNRTYRNYAEKVAKEAEENDLPVDYLMALIALECSGKRIVPHRYEPKVYEALIKVKSKQLDSYDNVNYKKVKNLSDKDIKDLASSWGPFQLMGYKSFELKCKISDISGSNSIITGVKWIDLTYGNFLRKKRFKDAFHIHNTGRKYPLIGPPRTFHKNYVPQGLKYMESFKEKRATN